MKTHANKYFIFGYWLVYLAGGLIGVLASVLLAVALSVPAYSFSLTGGQQPTDAAVGSGGVDYSYTGQDGQTHFGSLSAADAYSAMSGDDMAAYFADNPPDAGQMAAMEGLTARCASVTCWQAYANNNGMSWGCTTVRAGSANHLFFKEVVCVTSASAHSIIMQDLIGRPPPAHCGLIQNIQNNQYAYIEPWNWPGLWLQQVYFITWNCGIPCVTAECLIDDMVDGNHYGDVGEIWGALVDAFGDGVLDMIGEVAADAAPCPPGQVTCSPTGAADWFNGGTPDTSETTGGEDGIPQDELPDETGTCDPLVDDSCADPSAPDAPINVDHIIGAEANEAEHRINGLKTTGPASAGGSCPADVSNNVMGADFTISYQPMCDVASAVKPFLIAAAAISAALIAVGGTGLREA